MNPNLQIANTAMVVWCVVLLAACATGPGGNLEYRFDEPIPGANAGRDRVRAIERILRGTSAGCQSAANAKACSQYAMEGGLIYAMVEKQGVESENLLRQAYDYEPTCDLRILRATAIAKQARRRRDLGSATTLFAGDGERCDGTVARYYAAKLNLLSEDESRIITGREQLADLSSYSLGNSGIAPEDVHDLSVYSFVSTAEFGAAETQLRDAAAVGVAVSPKLQALVLIGRGGQGLFTVPDSDRASAKRYVDQRIEDYEFGAAINEFVQQAGRLASVAAVPRQQLEERFKSDPNLSAAQRRVLHASLDDEFKRLREEIAQLEEAKAAIGAYGPDLAAAEKRLVQAASATAFDSGDAEELATAKDAYIETVQRVARSLERINSVVGDMAKLQYLHSMLEEPDAYLRLVEAAGEISDRAVRLQAEDIDAAALRDFAVAVSRTLSPDEFFQAYEVDLDQLGFESESVVKNVRRVMELAGHR